MVSGIRHLENRLLFSADAPWTTKKKIQRSPRNFNPRSNKQKNNINFFQLKSNLQTSNNVGSSNHPVIINVKALLLSADAPRDNEKENPTTQAFFSFLSTALCHQKFSSPSLSVLLKNYNTVHFIVHSTQNC